jgi:hypothetical protein
VVGWLVFLAVDSMTGGTRSAAAWLAYLLPLAALAIVTLLQVRRLRTINTELVASTAAELHH